MQNGHINSAIDPNAKRYSAADSFVGMSLCSAFMGWAYGPNVELAFEAGEAASAVWEDRRAKDGKKDFQLGVNNAIGDIFARCSGQSPLQSIAEMEHNFFRPAAPAMAFRLH